MKESRVIPLDDPLASFAEVMRPRPWGLYPPLVHGRPRTLWPCKAAKCDVLTRTGFCWKHKE